MTEIIMLPSLWQRIFAYALLLVIASHLMTAVVFKIGYEKDQEMRIATDLTASITSALAGEQAASAEALLEFFRHERGELWMERPDGTLLSGSIPPGLEPDNRRAFALVRAPDKNVTLFETGLSEAPFLAESSVVLKDGPAHVFLLHNKRPAPPVRVIFIQGLIVVCMVGGTLSFWIARKISRPLNRLRHEVLAIADGRLDLRVTDEGHGEIAEVAASVNSLARNLAQNIKSMQELIANISHEIRSPLARMSYSTAIIENGLEACLRNYQNNNAGEDAAAPPFPLDREGEPLAVKHVRYINQEIEHLEKLIGSSLLNSRLDLQQQKFDIQPRDLAALCLKQARRHEALLESKGFNFQQAIEPVVWVNGDDALLSQVIANLLDNAGKYTTEGGMIRLNLSKDTANAFLSVENSHSGLSEEVRAHLFEPFYRGGLATADSAGVGLGLSLVAKIVACHGGAVAVENSDLGLLLTVRLALLQNKASGIAF